jgi:hypothetical protein
MPPQPESPVFPLFGSLSLDIQSLIIEQIYLDDANRFRALGLTKLPAIIANHVSISTATDSGT